MNNSQWLNKVIPYILWALIFVTNTTMLSLTPQVSFILFLERKWDLNGFPSLQNREQRSKDCNRVPSICRVCTGNHLAESSMVAFLKRALLPHWEFQGPFCGLNFKLCCKFLLPPYLYEAPNLIQIEHVALVFDSQDSTKCAQYFLKVYLLLYV